jgi:hypothetical protein
LGDSTIGIKVADGTYYPVLEHGWTGRKKLVLTTAKDNQERVQIDLYRGNGSALTQARYIGSLIIDNIPPAAQGQPEIELVIGVDEDGQLSAEASDTSTGESQRFATTLTADAGPGEDAEFVLESESPQDIDDDALAGMEDSEPSLLKRAESQRERRGPNVLLLVLFVILGIALVGTVAYFVYRAIQGPAVASLPTTAAQSPAAPAAEPAVTPAPAPAAQTAAEPAAPPAAKDTSYLIKKGDTLWDLASTYYRNPWLYPKLAKANGIRNPDLIFAGTRIVIPSN